MRQRKITRADKIWFVVDIILLIISLIAIIVLLTQAYHDRKYNCNDAWDNDTQTYYSSGCREECGCHIIAEYNIVVDMDQVGTVLNDIITNLTNKQNESDDAPCQYKTNEQTGYLESVGCREKCGCHIIKEYDLVISASDIGLTINDVIKNGDN